MGADFVTASPRVPAHAGSAAAAQHRAAAGGGEGSGRVSGAASRWGLLAGVLGVVVWLLVDPRTPDLAGQMYRANLFGEAGWIVWDGRWYAGHDIPGYSLLFGPLGSLLGVRAVGALAVLASTALFEGILRRVYGGVAARWGAVWFAVAALGDVWSGRIAFAMGVSFGLGAVFVAMGLLAGRAGAQRSRAGRWRAPAVGALAALCAACSPVAGALLALAGVTYSIFTRSWRGAVLLAAPALAVVAILVGFFGEGGWEPFPLLSFLATAAVLVGFLLALGRRRGLVWMGALVYLAVCVACVAVHTPMGANVERYGVLLAGPLLLCAALDRRGGENGRRAAGRAVTTLALLGIGVWTVWGPVRETLAVAGDPSTAASYYAPVERFVASHGGSAVRVEVPFTRGHWEAAWLARDVSLARGWEKQLDERYEGVLLSHRLSAASYLRWLREEAVGYVALPDARLDASSAREGRLIEAGLDYLRLVLRTPHWRIYAVRGATPIASGPGGLDGMGHDWFQLRARRAGRFVVRVRYTRYWTAIAGVACVSETPGGWTAVAVRRAGVVRVAARFSLGRALGVANGCS
jgi:hypothetical protein